MISTVASLKIPEISKRMAIKFVPTIEAGSHFRPQSLLAKVDSPMVVKFVTEENLTILKASTLVTVSERSWRSPLESHHRHADGEPHRCASQHVHSYDSRVTVAGVGLPAAKLCGTTTSEVCIETALCSSPSERRRMWT